ncbi:MAG: sigma-70 family RNA polymerase sigma factor [Myxococcales bacterium]|nr:sigma-70 family RNA polymerase sigma factor [Myxococcales bacterium]
MSQGRGHPDLDLVDASARGDRAAQRALMVRLVPVLQAQIGAMLLRIRGAVTEVDLRDLVQDTLVELLRSDSRELKRWDPARGLTLDAFVRLVARRFALRRLGRIGRHQHAFEATDPDVLDAFAGRHVSPQVADELDVLLSALYAELGPRDRELFERLFLEQQEPAEVATALGMSADALKKWRSRFYERATSTAARLERRPLSKVGRR